MSPRDRHVPTGRYSSRYDKESLLAIAVEIIGDLPDPYDAEQADYDDLLHSRYPDAPPARQTCARLGIRWADLKDKAMGMRADHERVDTPDRDRDLVIAAVTRTPTRQGRRPSQPRVDHALRWAARKTGGEPLRRVLYLHTYNEALPAQRKRLPTLRQICHALAHDGMTWQMGLKRAGLADEISWRGRRPGMSWDDALTMYLDDREELPFRDDLERWARKRGLMLASRQGEQASWAAIQARVREERAALGQSWPAVRSPAGDLMDVEPVDPDHPYVNRLLPVTLDGIRDGLILAFDRLEPGQRLDYDQLMLLWHTDPLNIPHPHRVIAIGHRHGLANPMRTLRAQASKQRALRDAAPEHPAVSDPTLEQELRDYLAGRDTWPPVTQWIAGKRSSLLERARADGVAVWCERLNVTPPPRRKPRYSEQELDRLLREYLVGHFDAWPASDQWDRDGKTDLLLAARRGLGTIAWSARLGLQPASRRTRRWNDEEIEKTLRELLGPDKIWPRSRDFRRAGHNTLYQRLLETDRTDEWIERLGAQPATRGASRRTQE